MGSAVANVGLLVAVVALALVGTLALGVAKNVRQRVGIRRAGAVVASCAGLILAWGVLRFAVRGPVDLNPAVRDAEVIGAWLCEDGRLTLAQDGTFAMKGQQVRQGRWRRDDWNLWLTDVGGGAPEYWRIVRFWAVPKLLPRWDDPAEPIPAECRQKQGA